MNYNYLEADDIRELHLAANERILLDEIAEWIEKNSKEFNY